MILGGPNRTSSFQRPSAASGGFMPKLPNTGFYSHLHPLAMVTHAMAADMMYRPQGPSSMGPTPMPLPPPAPVVVPSVAPTAPAIPKPGGTAGFGGLGFGSVGAMQHSHVDSYMVMRQGVIPGVMPNGSNIRAGYRNASQRVHGSFPFQTAALPPPPPPPAPVVVPGVPAVPATGVKGFLGTLNDHLGFPSSWSWFRRRPRHQAALPAMASGGCETIGPRSDGLYVTICNGQVTSYSDGRGNSRSNPYAT